MSENQEEEMFQLVAYSGARSKIVKTGHLDVVMEVMCSSKVAEQLKREGFTTWELKTTKEKKS